jgi:hypothetical protein
MAAQPIEAGIEKLLASAGYARAAVSIEPLPSGGNNRAFKVRAGQEAFFAKAYYHSTRDTRDRLHSEFAFLRHAWDGGLRCIPQPLAREPGLHLGLYEYVEGRRLAPGEVDEERVGEAAQFFAALNAARSRNVGGALPLASEACFSVQEHLAMVDTRLARLTGMQIESPIDREAAEFIASIAHAWQEHKRHILAEVAEPEATLRPRWRCLSPSDFGFHNALVRADGSLCFIDFEYAGWDDPAKAFGDFFSHPGSPVARGHRADFLRVAAQPFEQSEALLGRAGLLEPVFRLKWCCIILNEFLPEAAERRRFANPRMDPERSKAMQLEKAQRLSILPENTKEAH